MKRMKLNRQMQMKIASLVFFLLNTIIASAQDGNAGAPVEVAY